MAFGSSDPGEILEENNINYGTARVTCNGETVYTKDGLKGSYDSAVNPAYSDNALDAILYGNPSGFSPTRVEAELVVYVTELRGVSNVVEPEEPEVELLGKEIDECHYFYDRGRFYCRN